METATDNEYIDISHTVKPALLKGGRLLKHMDTGALRWTAEKKPEPTKSQEKRVKAQKHHG